MRFRYPTRQPDPTGKWFSVENSSTSQSTAASTTQAGRTAGLRRRVFRFGKGWRLVVITGPSEPCSSSRLVRPMKGEWFVRIEGRLFSREHTLTFTSIPAATNKTPKRDRAGGGSRRSGRE